MEDRRDPSKDLINASIQEHLRAANLHLQAGRFEYALRELEYVLSLDPKNYHARSMQERLRFAQKKEEERERNRLANRPPDEEEKLASIAELLKSTEKLLKTKEYDKAKELLKQVFAIEPQNYFARGYAERIDFLMKQDAGAARAQPAQKIPAPTAQRPAQAPAMSMKPHASAYYELLKEIWFDGKVDPEEEELLRNAREMFKVSMEEHVQLEKQVKIDSYVEALRIAWRDGMMTEEEEEVLALMREKYDISPEEHAGAEARILWAKNAPNTKGTILIVDSESDELTELTNGLRRHGYEVMGAEKVETALQLLKQQTPIIVLSSLMIGIGGTSGLEFFDMARRDARMKNIPFVFVSEVSDDYIVRACTRLGVDSFFRKPFDFELLAATIEGKSRRLATA